jgi:hypothetical protein
MISVSPTDPPDLFVIRLTAGNHGMLMEVPMEAAVYFLESLSFSRCRVASNIPVR